METLIAESVGEGRAEIVRSTAAADSKFNKPRNEEGRQAKKEGSMKERNERKRIVSAAIDIQKHVFVDCRGRLRGLGGKYFNFAPKHGLSPKFPTSYHGQKGNGEI